MRIALSVEAISPVLTGIGRYTYELATRLAIDDAINDLRYFREGDWIADPIQLLTEEPRRKRQQIRAPRWLRHLQMERQMKDRLFHGPNYFLPQSVESGLITIHDLSVIRFPETHPIERIKYFEREFASSLARASHVITDSETIRQEVIEYSGHRPEHVTAIPLGVSPVFYPHDPVELQEWAARYELTPKAYTLCISTIEPRKKIANLLRAWREVPRSLTQRTPLVVAGGSGWLSDDVREMMDQGVSDGWIKYLGYVREKDLPYLYAGASLFIYPSTYEGFGLPPIEAMASSVPVIVSDRSCLPEITKGAAMTVDPDDIVLFAKAIEKGLTDHAWREQAIMHGIQVAGGYTWEKCVNQTRQLYQHIIAGQSELPKLRISE